MNMKYMMQMTKRKFLERLGKNKINKRKKERKNSRRMPTETV